MNGSDLLDNLVITCSDAFLARSSSSFVLPCLHTQCYFPPMGKIFVKHRVVIRNAVGQIVTDLEADNFVVGMPVYENRLSQLPESYSITFQHGARVIKSAAASK